MKRLALAALCAVLGLAACSQSAAPTTSPTKNSATSPTAAPVSCRQQYHQWKHGAGKGLLAALHAVSAAGTAADSRALTVALRKARPAVARAARHPVPACADQRGYWDVLLMHVNAAAASKGSAASVRAAMKDIPMIEHKLIVELRHVPG